MSDIYMYTATLTTANLLDTDESILLWIAYVRSKLLQRTVFILPREPCRRIPFTFKTHTAHAIKSNGWLKIESTSSSSIAGNNEGPHSQCNPQVSVIRVLHRYNSCKPSTLRYQIAECVNGILYKNLKFNF